MLTRQPLRSAKLAAEAGRSPRARGRGRRAGIAGGEGINEPEAAPPTAEGPNVQPIETVTEEPPAASSARARGGRGRGRGAAAEPVIEAAAEPVAEPEPEADDGYTGPEFLREDGARERPYGGRGSRDRPDRGGRGDRGGRDDRGGARGRGASDADADLESEIDRALQEQKGIPPRPRPERTVVERTATERPDRDARAPRGRGTPREASREPRREFGPSEFNRRQIPERRPLPGQRGGGSAEAQIARQNVLFEEFTQQQSQTLREVQRLMSNMARGGSGTGAASGGGLMALPKVGIFLDVPNLIYAAEQIGARVHFGKLLDFLTEGRQLVRATAYAPITDDPSTRFESQRFVQPVLNNGYKIVTKPWKRFADGGMKANFDIELAVDILTMSDRLDIVVLLSGDGDFRRVCELVESKGVRVEVVSFAASTAMELRAVADSYIDLGSILHMLQP